MISTTPIVRPREMSGAHRIDRVRNWVSASNLPAKRAVFGGVVHDRRLAGLGDPAGDALSELHPEPGQVLALLPECQLERQLLRSSSTISIDQASDGISSCTRAMMSSITLFGSRIELAVFTMSVRIARRRAAS